MSTLAAAHFPRTELMLALPEERSYHILIVVGVAAAAALGLRAPLWPAWLVASCLVLMGLSLLSLTSAICLFLLLAPLNYWFRNAAPSSIPLSGARSIWLTIIVIGWLFAMSRRSSGLPKGADIIALLIFVAIGLVKMVSSGSLLVGFLGFREIAAPAMIYFAVRWTVSTSPTSVTRILRYLLCATVAILVFQLLWYNDYIMIDVIWNSARRHARTGVIGGGAGRTVMGHLFERMNSIIGGGPSNVGIFLGAGMWLAVGTALRQRQSVPRKLLLFTTAIALGYGSFLSLSRSVVVLTFGFLALYAIASHVSITTRTVGVALGSVLFVGVVLGTAFSNITLVDTIRQDAITWIGRIPTGVEAIFGGPFETAGGRLARLQVEHGFVDAGWVTIWAQLGLPGVLAMIVFLGVFGRACWVLARGVRGSDLPPELQHLGLACAAVALGLLMGSAHTAIIMRGGSDIMFYTLTACAIALARQARGMDGTAPAPDAPLRRDPWSAPARGGLYYVRPREG